MTWCDLTTEDRLSSRGKEGDEGDYGKKVSPFSGLTSGSGWMDSRVLSPTERKGKQIRRGIELWKRKKELTSGLLGWENRMQRGSVEGNSRGEACLECSSFETS